MNATDMGDQGYRGHHAAVMVEPSDFVPPNLKAYKHPCFNDLTDDELDKNKRNCAILMLFGGHGKDSIVYNDLWAYRNFSSAPDDRVFVAFRNGRSAGNIFLQNTDHNSSIMHIVGGVVNNF